MKFNYIIHPKCKDIIKFDFFAHSQNPPPARPLPIIEFDNLPTLQAIFNNWQDTTNLLLLVIKKVGVVHKLSS